MKKANCQADKEEEVRPYCSVANNIGLIYKEMGLHKKALYYFE